VAELSEQLRSGLADRYRLERELGRGGMATVFLAHDLRHDRPVALKVLHPELAATLGPERFQREIKLAARLQHPHILPLLDSGDASGFLYYVMPYVDGESLRARLARQGELSIHDAIKVLLEVTDALALAHEHGVVHRDIKPDNVLLSGRHALVTDFGVAKAVSEATGRQQLTTAGVALGTPAYMAPEQATADPHVDHRADIYALGVLGYELIAGVPPFTGRSSQEVLGAHLTQRPERLCTRRPACPPGLEAVIMRCLEKRPADRWQTADELLAQLEPLAAASGETTPTATRPVEAAPRSHRPRRRVPVAPLALGIGFLIGLGMLFGWLRTRPRTEAANKRLAVLPFENLGGPENEYFAEGITDAVRGKLTALPSLRVIARSSSSQYKKTSKSPQQIGQELGVQYLLTGTVRWDKGAGGQSRVQVSPELVEVQDASTRWQQPFDAPLTDVFQVQADIAGRVAQALDVAMGNTERQVLATKPTSDSAAYDYYLRGNVYLERGIAEPDLRMAEELYQKAIARDSTFTLAYAQLSRTHDQLYWFYYDRSEARLAKQKEAADRALRLQPDLAEGHLALGFYYYHGYLDYERALREFEIARKLQPSNGDVYFAIGVVRRRQGKWAEALASQKKGVELDPRSAFEVADLGNTELRVLDYAAAERYLVRALEIDPEQGLAYSLLSTTYLLWRGDTAAAQQVLRQAMSKMGPERALPQLVAQPFGLNPALSSALFDSVLARTPLRAFGSDTVAYYRWKAQFHSYHRHADTARMFLDSARVELEAEVARLPNDPRAHGRLGVIYLELGLRAEARREGERAVALVPISQDASRGALFRQGLARILMGIGDAEAAVEQLAYLLSVPSLVSVPLLGVDPTWDPLRGNPRFQRLLERKQ
jgi:serine/threonine protein kinase/tetratricopeptide (TPR) repeat protein